MEVRWKFFVHLKTMEKVPRILSKFEQSMGVRLVLQSAARYWKDQTIVVISALSSIQAETIAQGVFEILITAQRIGRDWSIQGPTECSNHHWRFSGWSNAGSLPGLRNLAFESAELEINNQAVVHFKITDTE